MTKPFAAFDPGPSGALGPWLIWSAQTRGFTLRVGGDKTPFDGFDRGVVLDVETMKTGWQRGDGTPGVAPEWLWNESLERFAPRPGEEWKQGFHLACALGEGRTAVWEQAGPSAWNGILGLVPALRAQPAEGALPLVRLTGTREKKFAKGKSVIPVLEVVKWVARPACLMEGEAPPAPSPDPTADGPPSGPTVSRAQARPAGQIKAQAEDQAVETDADFDEEVPF